MAAETVSSSTVTATAAVAFEEQSLATRRAKEVVVRAPDAGVAARSPAPSKRCTSTREDGEMDDVRVKKLEALDVAVAVAEAVIVGVGTSSVVLDVELDVEL
jgi:hypothetical protein